MVVAARMISIGAHHLAADHELAALLDLQRAEQVGAVGDRDPCPLADLQRPQAAVDDEIVLRQHVAAHPELGRALAHGVVGDEVRDQEHAFLGHQLGRRIVDQVAVLDRAHAAMRGAGDRFRRVGMGADVAPEGVRLLDGGGDLAGAELQAVERIIRRRHAARHHDLDVVGALAHLLARFLAHLGHAVRRAHPEAHGVAAMAAHAEIGAPARIAVSAGRADRGARDEQPRPRNVALLDRGLQTPVGAAGVADAGEAAVEHAEHQPRGARGHQGQRHGFEVADIDLAQGDVDVAVDQARASRCARRNRSHRPSRP